MIWKKEYLLIVVAVICLIIFWYRKQFQNETAKKITQYLPVIGGLVFGLNTLISLVNSPDYGQDIRNQSSDSKSPTI